MTETHKYHTQGESTLVALFVLIILVEVIKPIFLIALGTTWMIVGGQLYGTTPEGCGVILLTLFCVSWGVRCLCRLPHVSLKERASFQKACDDLAHRPGPVARHVMEEVNELIVIAIGFVAFWAGVFVVVFG